VTAGHRDRGRDVAMRAARDREQVLGVARRARAAAQNRVVGGELALDAQPSRRQPRERVHPLHGQRELRDRVRDAVAPAHVRELVQQHDAPALGVPARRGARDHDDRRDRADHDRRVDVGARDEPRRRAAPADRAPRRRRAARRAPRSGARAPPR
jgi:hypothetical protein